MNVVEYREQCVKLIVEFKPVLDELELAMFIDRLISTIAKTILSSK